MQCCQEWDIWYGIGVRLKQEIGGRGKKNTKKTTINLKPRLLPLWPRQPPPRTWFSIPHFYPRCGVEPKYRGKSLHPSNSRQHTRVGEMELDAIGSPWESIGKAGFTCYPTGMNCSVNVRGTDRGLATVVSDEALMRERYSAGCCNVYYAVQARSKKAVWLVRSVGSSVGF
ncbi:hypothetical protein VTK26DRAFT_5469 [Humicola hyalothermophila]